MIKAPFLLLVTFCSLAFGCTKTDERPSKVDILTKGKWRLTSYVYMPGFLFPEQDLYAPLDPCVKDNYYIFFANGTGEMNEGPTRCNGSANQTEMFNWQISENNIFFYGSWEFYIYEGRLHLGTERASGSFEGYDKTYNNF